jgi:hypothetical protein
MVKSMISFPSVLFKYRDYENEYHRKMLFEQEIFLSSFSNFNDPYEGNIPFMYKKEELTNENIFLKMRELAISEFPNKSEAEIHEICFDAIQKDLLHDEKHLEREKDNIRKDLENDFGILSLTSKPTNYLMWSHYANSHKGFVIGFGTKELKEFLQSSLCTAIYSNELPRISLFGGVADFHKTLLATKSKVWEYEDEYRITKVHAANKPFIIPKSIIKEVYLGCKMDQEKKNRIIEYLKENIPHCNTFDLCLNMDEFKFNVLQVL